MRAQLYFKTLVTTPTITQCHISVDLCNQVQAVVTKMNSTQHFAVWKVTTNVSQECTVSIFSVSQPQRPHYESFL